MSEITKTPEFEEWFEFHLDRIPAPSPEVARRLVDLLMPDSRCSTNISEPGH